MPATKIDVPALNVKASALFEDSKSALVRNKEAKKETDRKIAEVNEAIAEATKALESKDSPLDAQEKRHVSRALDRLNITKNYLEKAVGAFDDVESGREKAAEELAKKRKTKEALIAKRAEERKVRDDNRKKAEVKK